jgi:large subunit ribosomal protein L15
VTDLGLHNLHPAAGSHRTRKRVGRGTASGTGKTSGRGQKGQKSRSGSHYMRPGFEGGQMPLYMRLGKLRGPHMKKSMPMGPFRTSNEIVNLEQLAERFEAGAEVTPATLVAAGLLKHTREPVKVLGRGELSVALTVSAHAFSASARQKIEAAGGTVTVLDRGPKPADAETAAPAADAAAPAKPKSRAKKAKEPVADAAPVAEEPAADEPAEEPEASADAGDSEAADEASEADETDDAEAE